MGGAVFAAGPKILFTPRMPAHVYKAIMTQCQARLRQLYVHVATPIEGPEKLDFGDVDIFVAKPRAHSAPLPTKPNMKSQPTQSFGDSGKISRQDTEDLNASKDGAMAHIKNALGAQAMKYRPSVKPNGHFAVPWPKADELESPADMEEEQIEQAERFIQVDVRVCKTEEEFQWMLFKHSHGDLWSLLGLIIRPLGLTADDDAFCLRIPEIEKVNRKLARISLSHDPEEVLYFLGLRKVTEPFDTLQDMFDYVSKSRLFWISKSHPISGGNGDGEARPDSPEDVAPDNQGLKAKVRRKSKRAGFQRWAEEYIPACRAKGLYRKRPITRTEIQEQVFRFWPGSKREFDDALVDLKKLDEWTVVKSQILAKSIAMPELVSGQGEASIERHNARRIASGTRRAFLRMFFPKDPHCIRDQPIQQLPKEEIKKPEDYGIPPPPGEMLDEQGLIKVEIASEWVEKNKEQVSKVVREQVLESIGDWQVSKQLGCEKG